jgi:hypothetical protein
MEGLLRKPKNLKSFNLIAYLKNYSIIVSGDNLCPTF